MIETVDAFLARLKQRDPHQPEFHQAVEEVVRSLCSFLEANPRYMQAGILERMVKPERAIMFRVPWIDDQGRVQVNRGFRIQMSSAIGPYKGGLRFHPSGQHRRTEIPRLRAGVQELPDLAANGRRQGRLGLQPQGQERQRSDALLPVVHDRAVPPHRRGFSTYRPVTSASAAARSASSSASTSACPTSSPRY
ncbi:hypothetical protein SSTU70S_02685 [Stutzerimonas stutzeri]